MATQEEYYEEEEAKNITEGDLIQLFLADKRKPSYTYSYKCSNCDYKTINETRLLRHQQRKHIGESCRVLKIGCSLCNKDIHHTVHQSRTKGRTVGGEYSCHENQCNFTTNQLQKLGDHQKNLHEGIKRFACSHCDYKNYDRVNVLKHQAKRHIGQNCRQLKIGCSPCIKNKYHTVHQEAKRARTVVGKYSCLENQCKFSTNRRYRLKDHQMKFHEGIKEGIYATSSQKAYW